MASLAHKTGVARALALATAALATTGRDTTALDVFVAELPREEIPEFKGRVEVRFCREALTPPPAPTPPAASGSLDTVAAGVYLGGRSADWIREQVRRGALKCVRNKGTRSRIGIPVPELDRWNAAHVAPGPPDSYSQGDAKAASPRAPHRARLDPNGARPRPRRDEQHGRPVGTRRPRRARPGRDEPFTPSAETWRLPVDASPGDPKKPVTP